MSVERIDVAEFHRRCKAQSVSAREHIALVCPVCGTVQSMASLIRAGAEADTVENFLGFSCEGRFSNAGSWPGSADGSAAAKKRRLVRGCNWTLGGFLKIHRLEVVDDDGPHPRFELATPEQARTLETLMTTKPTPSEDAT